MKFVVISDTHGLHEDLQDLPNGDVIIHAGDFCHFSGAESRKRFLSWYADLNYRYKILISGNHDFMLLRTLALFWMNYPKVLPT